MFKKIVFLFLLGAVFVTGCKKDEPSKTDVNTDKIVGEWTMTSASSNDGESVTTLNGTTITSTFTWEAKDINAKINFKDDKTFDSYGSYTLSTVTTTNGQVITTEASTGEYQYSGTWKLNGDELETTNDTNGETGKGKILVLDDHNLKTQIKATITRNVNGGTQVATQTVIATYTR